MDEMINDEKGHYDYQITSIRYKTYQEDQRYDELMHPLLRCRTIQFSNLP